MSNLITSASSWLTDSHSLEMAGWVWIIVVPILIVTLAAIFYALLWIALIRSFRPW